jgi:aryl-alcohol dehydrogenase
VTRPAEQWIAPMASMLAGGRKLQGILGGGAAPQLFIPQLITHWQQGRFPFDRLISEFNFDQIGAAWEACTSGAALKPVLIQ